MCYLLNDLYILYFQDIDSVDDGIEKHLFVEMGLNGYHVVDTDNTLLKTSSSILNSHKADGVNDIGDSETINRIEVPKSDSENNSNHDIDTDNELSILNNQNISKVADSDHGGSDAEISKDATKYNSHRSDYSSKGFINNKEKVSNDGNMTMKQVEWDLFIAHFLGVDHIGHSFSAHHVLMGDRLSRMDDLLLKVIDRYVCRSSVLLHYQ